MNDSEHPYSPPQPEVDNAQSPAKDPQRNLFWMLSVRFALLICAVASTRTFPRGSDLNEIVGFGIAILGLILFAALVLMDLHKHAS